METDQVLLQQVLLNLVINAMDAMAEMPPPLRQMTITTDVSAAEVDVTVCDTGPGLPADINATRCSAGWKHSSSTKSHGIGIGLTIARSIIDAHGGTIEACNNAEGGAGHSGFRCTPLQNRAIQGALYSKATCRPHTSSRSPVRATMSVKRGHEKTR